MKSTQLILTLAALALLLPGVPFARNIDNYLKDGFPVLVPEVQRLEKLDETFTLPKVLNVSAPENAQYEASLIGDYITRRFPGFSAAITTADKAQCRLILSEENVPGSPEGYTLSITRQGIEIRSRSAAGLFYGAHTLGNIITSNVKIHLPGCRITDHPDLEIRGLFLNLRHLKNPDVPKFAGAIRKLAALKLNTLVLEFAENLPLQNNPFTARKEFLSQESLDLILNIARENHMMVIPHIQAVTHESWLKSHPDYKTRITSDASNDTWLTSICPEKPLGRELTEYTIRETVRLIKPKYFHLALDEFDICHWEKCDVCLNGHTTEQLVREVRHYFDLCAELGVTPWVYHDAFLPGHPQRGEEALKYMAKDTVINMWSYIESPTAAFFKFFKNEGFKDHVGVSYCTTFANAMTMPVAAKKHDAKGVIFTYWNVYMRRNFTDVKSVSPQGAAGTVVTANYTWKTSGKPYTQLSWDPARELRRRLFPTVWHRPAGKYAGIPLTTAFNARLGRDESFPLWTPEAVKKLQRDAAAAPEGYSLAVNDDGTVSAVLLSGGNDNYSRAPITIPVSAKLGGLSFLAATTLPRDQMAFGDPGKPKPLAMPEVARLKINYADGTSATCLVEYYYNINDWNSETSGIDCRFVARGNDSRGAEFALYAFDWQNAKPKVEISSIEFSTAAKYGLATALFAASAVNPGENFPLADNGAVGELIDYSTRAGSQRAPELHVMADFENGMGNAVFLQLEEFSRPPKAEIVNDPTSPKAGKVLKITVPPAKLSYKRVRVMVDVTIPDPKPVINTLFCDYRVDNPAMVQHTGFYLMDKKISAYNVFYSFHTIEDHEWRTLYVPLGHAKKEKGGVTQETAAKIRVSFWVLNHTEDVHIYVDNIGVSPDITPLLMPYNRRKVE